MAKKPVAKKAAAKKATAKTATAKTATAKKAMAKKAMARKAMAKKTMVKTKSKAAGHARPARGTAKPAARRKMSAKARQTVKARPKHRFTVSHHRDEDFRSDGLRRYAAYRNLGIDAATDGMAVAHVIRLVPPCDPAEVSKLHYHDVDFQMVYVLKGSMTSEFEGHGPITMRAGSCWIQPPGIKHKVLDYSDDCEVLEIVLPADFKTVELE
jgi:mannose-6-phosphate isomerase-like protein (cupin superfamily)